VVIIRGSFATISVSSGVTCNGQTGGSVSGQSVGSDYYYEITATTGSSQTITI
jgi:hypothetical protein